MFTIELACAEPRCYARLKRCKNLHNHAHGGYKASMQVPLIIQALTGVGALVAAIGIGMCMVLCTRSHFSDVSTRVRQYLRR